MAGVEKFQFAAQGEPITSGSQFMDIVSKTHADFHGAKPSFGIGEGGYAQSRSGHVAALRHPRRIPDKISDGIVHFGGQQSDTHIEVSMARPDSHEAQRRAHHIIESLHRDGLEETSRKNGGVFAVGNEAEMWIYHMNGNPYILPTDLQEELHGNLWETATKPALRPHEQQEKLARDMLARAARLPDGIINNSSMPLVTSPHDQVLNTNPDIIPYVLALQTDMFNNLFDPSDRVALNLWNSLAKSYGFSGLEQLKDHVGNLSLWAMAAAHASVGLSHTKNERGHVEVSTEHAIAVGDVFNSNLANVGEWMAYSTPLVFGQQPSLQGMTPRDYRAALKLGVLTTYPSDFARNVDSLHERMHEAITTGVADRIDRAVYISEIRRRKVASSHGRLRARLAHPNIHHPYETTGRIEFTGAGSTPDIEATVARNSYLQLLAIHAYEAVAAGEHPMDHSGTDYPAIATNNRQRYLSHRYNFYGPEDPQTSSVIDQAKRLITDMGDRYEDPAIQELCESALVGIEKVQTPSKARSLDEYADSHEGLISDPIAQMARDGASPLDIAKEVHDFQIRQAETVMTS